MKSIEHYCPVVEKCPHEPVRIKQNHFFLIEPFDEFKEKREKSIEDGLKNYFKKRRFSLVTADREITLKSLYCDICKKIKSCQVCIVDITPRILYKELKNEDSITRAIKENVMLELGLSYGLQKPVIIISRKVKNQRLIPSDLGFIRYLDNSSDISFDTWNELSDKIIGILSGIKSIGFYRKQIPDNQREIIKKLLYKLKIIYYSKKYKKEIDEKNLYISEFRLDENGYIIAIIPKGTLFKENMILRIIKIDNGFETPIGVVKIFHVQQNGIAQGYCIYEDKDKEKHLSDKINESDNKLVAYNNKLNVFVDDDFKEQPIDQLENIINTLEIIL